MSISPNLIKTLVNLAVCGFGVFIIHYLFTDPPVVLEKKLNIPILLQIPITAIVAAVSRLIVNLVNLQNIL